MIICMAAVMASDFANFDFELESGRFLNTMQVMQRLVSRAGARGLPGLRLVDP